MENTLLLDRFCDSSGMIDSCLRCRNRKKKCQDRGLNTGPPDAIGLQSVALPAELSRPYNAISVKHQHQRISSKQTASAHPRANNIDMSGTGPRENVFATRMALTNTKLRLKGAQTGHSLLAKKRDALTTRFRAILKKVDEVSPSGQCASHFQSVLSATGGDDDQAKRKMGRVMQLASLSMAEVTYATGDISYLVQEQVKSASFRVKAKQENVSGVVLPAFEVDRVPGSGAIESCIDYELVISHD